MKPAVFRAALILPLLMSVTFHSLAMEPNGTAVYSELGSQLYMGTLFLDTPNDSAGEVLNSSQKKRMELRFTDSMSKRRWTQNWTQSIAINSPRDSMISAADDLSATLNAFRSGLKHGDQVAIEYDPLYGTSVSINDVTLVEGKSATLFNLFLSAWIGPVPPSREFKEAILGQTDSQNEYTTFVSLSPSEERIAAVRDWDTELREQQLAAEEEAKREAEEEARRKAEEEARQQAEEEAMKQAEEEARRKAEAERLAEEQQQDMVEEEEYKAQEAARENPEEEATDREAERVAREEEEAAAEAEQAPQSGQQAAAEGAEEDAEEEDEVDVSVEAILAQQDYTTQIIRQIYSSVRYPRSAIRKNQEGSVRAIVSIDRSGNLAEVVLTEECEHDSLNEAAIDAIRDAAPFPAIPDAVREDRLDLMVPVAFRLN